MVYPLFRGPICQSYHPRNSEGKNEGGVWRLTLALALWNKRLQCILAVCVMSYYIF